MGEYEHPWDRLHESTINKQALEMIAKNNRVIELEEKLRHRRAPVIGLTIEQAQRLVDLATERVVARAAKDYARADALRKDLLAAGLKVQDRD